MPSRKDMNDALSGYADEAMTAKDLSDVLRDLARMYERPRAGNYTLASALHKLSRIVRRYADRDLEEVLTGLRFSPIHQRRKTVVRSSRLRGIDLAPLDLERVRELLDDPELTRGDLIELAAERFGISRSRLQRQNKEAVVEAIEAASRNAEALDIISKEAGREGSRRAQ